MIETVVKVMFALGIMIAISGAAKIPEDGRRWPDSFPIYAGGTTIAFVALVRWRVEKAKGKAAAAKQATRGEGSPFELLASLQEPLERLRAEVGELEPHALCERVDELLETWILPFADRRQQVIDRLGMRDGAEVLVAVAFGERMLNRVWSAAGDHHLPEAAASLEESIEGFREAQHLAARAIQTQA